MSAQEWIGKLVEIRDRRWHKSRKLRIVDAEIAADICNCGLTCDSEGDHTWFWAKNA